MVRVILIAKLLKYIKIYIADNRWVRKHIIPAYLSLLGSVFLEIYFTALKSELTTEAQNKNTSSFSLSLFMTVFICGQILRCLYDIFFAYFISQQIEIAQARFLGNMLKLKYSEFHKLGVGKIQAELYRKFSGGIEFFTTLFMFFSSTFIYSFCIFIRLYSFLANTKCSLFLTFYLGLFLIVFTIVHYLKTYLMNKVNEGHDIGANEMQEILFNYDFIVPYDRIDEELVRYKQSLFHHTLWNILYWVSYDLENLLNLLYFVFVYATLLTHLETVNIKSFSLQGFTLLFNMAKNEIFTMNSTIDYITYGFVSFDKSSVEHLELDNNNIGIKTTFFDPEIKASNLNFSFSNKKVLHDLSFVIKPGEKIAIVGYNGTGKSVLLKILVGLYDYEGRLYINNHEYKETAKVSIRRVISYIPQNLQLFNSTIAENLRFGNMGMSDYGIFERCEKHNMHELFKHLDYNKSIGEKGKYLSKGYQQKICIMRAIIRNTPVLLLDEATSNIDAISEMEIVQLIPTRMQSKTVIMVIHNLATLQYFDRVMFFDNNNVVELNTLENLMKNEQFNSFYNLNVNEYRITDEID